MEIHRTIATKRKLGFASGLGVALLVLIGAVQIAGAAGAAKGPTSAATQRAQAERVRETVRMIDRATVEANVAVARRFLADEFELINPLGVPTSREDYLGSIASGDLDFLAFDPVSEIVVRLYGNAAVARYRSSIDLAAFGLRLTHQAWHTELLERRHGTWQVVWAQTTAIPNNPGLVIEALKRPV